MSGGEEKRYSPDREFEQAYGAIYQEAQSLDDEGLAALCPSYAELCEVAVRYRDAELIGSGALKEVYRTYDTRTKRWVAMARLRKDRGPEFNDVIVHEAWLTSSLNHPNIINIHDAGVDEEGRPFFTMDLKGDSTLADMRDRAQPNEFDKLLEVFLKVCDAVAYAHSKGVLHLDVKPENIQVDSYGEVVLCDWGLGKRIDAEEEGEEIIPEPLWQSDNMTLMGEIKGTLGFMAPEQMTPKGKKDEETDVFSLGCLLYYLLAGEPPMKGSVEEMLSSTAKASIAPLGERFPELRIAESLQAIVTQATAKIPANRYPSVGSLREDLEKYRAGFATQAEKPSWLKKVWLFWGRHRTPILTGVGVILLLGFLVKVYSKRIEQKERRAVSAQQRAERFEEEMGARSLRYEKALGESKAERGELASELTWSANKLKNLGIFTAPEESVREAYKLASTALALAPTNPNTRWEVFDLSCTQMDFSNANKYPPRSGHRFEGYLAFSKNFGHYSFSGEERPSLAELEAYFEKARELNPEAPALMERVLSFDLAIRGPVENPERLIQVFLEYLNGPESEVAVKFDEEERSLTLDIVGGEKAILMVPRKGGSGLCVLRFFNLKKLTLVTSSDVRMGQLSGLETEFIDLTGCKVLTSNEEASLPRLQEIAVNGRTVEEDWLRRRIETPESYRVLREE